jgi:isopenicillin N synthase-like dioxygenase
MGVFEAVPILDLSDYISCDTSLRSPSIDVLGAALVGCGFVVIEGHGVEARLIEDAYRLWRQFFALEDAVKRRYAGTDGGARGFTPFGVEHARDNPTPDLKEFWHVGQEPSAAGAVDYPPNVWPVEVPGLRQATLLLYHELERVAQHVLLALAEFFGLPEETFASMARGGASVLRILHYPPLAAGGQGAAAAGDAPGGTIGAAGAMAGGGDSGLPAGALRAAPHADINLITLLCEATGAGLEVQRHDGTWMPVAARPGQIVVDAGEMLSRVTNQVVPAAIHRVVNPRPGPGEAAAGERFSMPFFVHPRPACDLAVLPRFVSAERPCRFPPITAGQLLDQRLREIGMKR